MKTKFLTLILFLSWVIGTIPVKADAPAGVEMVDLGLPSGILWANMNVGATSPEGYGDYFAWGEVEPYNWNTYKWCNGSGDTMTKYCTSSDYGTVDGKTTLEPEDDAAHVNWGGSWRMPTHTELEEFINNCTVTWTSNYNGTGVAGCIFTSKRNSNSIFFPAAGICNGAGLCGNCCGCWSSSLYEGSSYFSWCFDYSMGVDESNHRSDGLSVRAVCPAATPTSTTYTITFIDANGETLQSSEVAEGEMPAYTGATPTKAEDANYTYEFSGWSPAIVAATAAAIYTAQFTATQKVTQGLPAGVEMVDLGLPSGVKWANMNVGAAAPEQYGLYFAWGETQGYTCDTNDGRSFDWANYKWMTPGQSSRMGVNKYTFADNQPSGVWYQKGVFVGDNKTVLDAVDDAATANWHGDWRIPTDAEWTELRINCTWKRTRVNGVNGYRVSAMNGNSIFLPAAGRYHNMTIDDVGSYGGFWSASLYSLYSYDAYCVSINYPGDARRSACSRYYGLSVRAVCPASLNEYHLTDGVAYTENEDKDCESITYTRTFNNTQWQALYVPFSMQYEDWEEEFEVAKLTNVHQYDDDNDGVVDRTILETLRLTSGATVPNRPYMIRAKSTGDKTITAANTTLHAAAENSISCASTEMLYIFQGTYSGVTLNTSNVYALSGGKMAKPSGSVNLKPMRWYLHIESKDPSAVPPAQIAIQLIGEEEEVEEGITTAIDVLPVEAAPAPISVYTIDGRLITMIDSMAEIYLLHLPTGIYVANGNRVFVP